MKNSILLGKYFLLLAFFSTSILISCQKDKDEEPPPPTKKELLSNKWKVSDVKDASGTSIIGLPLPQIICLKDNIFTLRTDDSYVIDEGAVACDPSTAGSGTWSLISNDSKIEFTPSSGAPLTFDLIDIDTATLKIAYAITGTGMPGADGIYTIILVKA